MFYYCCFVCMFVYVYDLYLWAQMSRHMHMYIIGWFHGMGFLFPWFSKISWNQTQVFRLAFSGSQGLYFAIV